VGRQIFEAATVGLEVCALGVVDVLFFAAFELCSFLGQRFRVLRLKGLQKRI
jgi:hypothetical protein